MDRLCWASKYGVKKHIWRVGIYLCAIVGLYYCLRIAVPYYFVLRINSITNEKEESVTYATMHHSIRGFLGAVGLMSPYGWCVCL